MSATILRNWPEDGTLIHAHSSLLNGIAARRAARRRDVPFLYEARAFWEDAAVDQGRATETGLRYKLTRRAETSLFRSADRVTVICEGLKNDVIERGIDPDRITVIPNGVDIDKFTPLSCDEDLRRELQLNDKCVFGFIGTFFHFEGLRLLVEAMEELQKERSDVHLLLVGAGQEDEVLRTMVREKGLSDIVTFTGRVKHDEVKRYYSVVDVLVYPRISKRITELVTPLKPLEAMALRKSVMGSRVGGIRELVEDGQTGLLFDSDNVSDLADKMRYAVDNPQHMQTLADNGREYVVAERTWSSVAERYLPIYESLGRPQTQRELIAT